MTFKNNDNIVILMATYQGERYIYEQLMSFERQSYTNWRLIISDDGSTDNTITKISGFILKNFSKVKIVAGPKKGFVCNFLSLLLREDATAKYYSFSDQDDIWYENKISCAIKWLKNISINKPALYCSRTHLINEKGEIIGASPLFTRSPSFCNALVQSIGGGNTMVMNEEARKIICRAGVVNVVSHDWWIYILISGAGGEIYYDPQPSLGYRQHDKNIIGANLGLKARLFRFEKIIRGHYRSWNAAHIHEIEKIKFILTEENQKMFCLFKAIHTKNIILRVYYFFKLGVYRQTKIGTLAIFIAVLLKKYNGSIIFLMDPLKFGLKVKKISERCLIKCFLISLRRMLSLFKMITMRSNSGLPPRFIN